MWALKPSVVTIIIHCNNFVLFKVDYEKDDTEFIVKPQNENCKSDKMTIFVGVIYAYKGLLLVSLNLNSQHCTHSSQ